MNVNISFVSGNHQYNNMVKNMIPEENSSIQKEFKYFLLEYCDLVKEGDEYYNNCVDAWLPVEDEFIGYEYDPEESKPVRRKNPNFRGDE